MLAAGNQPSFTITIRDMQRRMRVLSFNGQEALNQPYRFNVQLVSERSDVDLNSLLHQPAYLAFDQNGAGIHGLIRAFSQGHTHGRWIHYELTLVPHLDYLRHRVNQRIFQQQTVEQIIATVLEENGILADRRSFLLKKDDYEPRNFCTQYKESDLDFIQRLCAEEGFSYRFEHSSDQHMLIFGDSQMSFNLLSRPVSFMVDAGMVDAETAIDRFSVGVQTATSRVILDDYDFHTPHIQLHGKSSLPYEKSLPAGPGLEHYEYPGLFEREKEGHRQATRRLQSHQVDTHLANGASNHPPLLSGQCLTLQQHPREDWNDRWLLISVEHMGKQPQVLEEMAGPYAASPEDGFSQGYRNTFTAMPWKWKCLPYARNHNPEKEPTCSSAPHSHSCFRGTRLLAVYFGGSGAACPRAGTPDERSGIRRRAAGQGRVPRLPRRAVHENAEYHSVFRWHQ